VGGGGYTGQESEWIRQPPVRLSRVVAHKNSSPTKTPTSNRHHNRHNIININQNQSDGRDQNNKRERAYHETGIMCAKEHARNDENQMCNDKQKESIANQARNRRHRAKAHNKKTCKKGSHCPVTSQERHHGREEQTRVLQHQNTDGINTRARQQKSPFHHYKHVLSPQIQGDRGRIGGHSGWMQWVVSGIGGRRWSTEERSSKTTS